MDGQQLHATAERQHNWQSHQQLPPPKQSQKCPRCDSANTKFGYYNNYSVTQPRYFCRACRRYWTHGGTLRNIPVGGGSRKGKQGKSSESHNSRFHPLEMDKAMAIPPVSSSYSGSGFLYTLANIQSQRQNLSPYNTPPTSNSAIFQNRARTSPSFGLFHAKSEPDSQFVNRNESGTEYYRLYPAGPDLTIPNSKSTPVRSWNQTSIANNSTASIDQTFWSSDLAS